MIEEAAFDVSGNNLEFINQYCRTVFQQNICSDLSLYLEIMSGQKNFFEKENRERTRGNDRKWILLDLEIMISVVLSELKYSIKSQLDVKLRYWQDKSGF